MIVNKKLSKKLNRHERRKREKHLEKCHLVLINKKTKKKTVARYKYKVQPTIDEMLEKITINKKPVIKEDYDIKIRKG